MTGLPAGIVNLAAGETFCLALANDSTVWGWGDNSRSQLGHDSQTTQNPVPKQIQNFGNVVAIAGGRQHSVALKADGSVWAWGNNQVERWEAGRRCCPDNSSAREWSRNRNSRLSRQQAVDSSIRLCDGHLPKTRGRHYFTTNGNEPAKTIQ